MTEVATKFCKHCNCEHLHTAEFWTYTHGYLSTCKAYTKYVNKRYKDVNKTALKQKAKIYNELKSEEIKERKKISDCKYYLKNKDKIKSHRAQYYQTNKEQILQSHKEYRTTNAATVALYFRNKYATDLNHKIGCILRKRLHKAMNTVQKNGSAVRDLGCTITEFKMYIEAKFQEGMSWDNWTLKGWHLDHIIPLAKFDLTDPEQVRQACHYTNLQPLWAVDNLSKKDKILEEIICHAE